MLLKLENVKKQYGNFQLKCSMEVNAGCVTGLIGKNGAGKSTTFKAILGLIHSDGGQIEVFGKPVEELTVEEKGQIGVVLSNSGFSGYLTIQDLLPVMRSMYPKFREQEFLDRCREFQLPLNKKLKEFSTGMRRKFQVLTAISFDARLLILDEPTAGLDVIAREKILDLLRAYMEEEDRGILISSHISSDLEGFCDDIYMIDDGKIIMHEDTDVLLSDYGLLKMTEEEYQTLDKTYILRSKKKEFGYSCLTNQKQFYLENYPKVVIEKGNIDEVIMMMIRGEENEGIVD